MVREGTWNEIDGVRRTVRHLCGIDTYDGTTVRKYEGRKGSVLLEGV